MKSIDKFRNNDELKKVLTIPNSLNCFLIWILQTNDSNYILIILVNFIIFTINLFLERLFMHINVYSRY